MRILLVEYDPVVAQSIGLMLRTERLEIETTSFGESGIDIGRLETHHLIILDLTLPDLSGFEVLRALRAGRVRTPILILSGVDGYGYRFNQRLEFAGS
jgi:two-component system, cell cycle response regulator CtrA